MTYSDGEKTSLTYSENLIHSDLIWLLQYLESSGGFCCGVSRILWDCAEFEWGPESNVERDRFVVWDLRVDRKYRENLTEIDEKHFNVLTRRRPWHEPLTVLLAIHREGNHEFLQLRYIQAFVSCYFTRDCSEVVDPTTK
ncbi:MAG: hypothetical protein IH853_07800 [Bacteroidetes bacterium]|nr:hypothetical protein [Bacteroidota bacterium]